MWLPRMDVCCVLVCPRCSSDCIVGFLWTSEGLFGVYVWHPFEFGGVLEDASGQDSKTDDDIRCVKIGGNVNMLIFHMC